MRGALTLVGAIGLTLVGAIGLSLVGAIGLSLVGAIALSRVGAIGLSRVGARALSLVGLPIGARAGRWTRAEVGASGLSLGGAVTLALVGAACGGPGSGASWGAAGASPQREASAAQVEIAPAATGFDRERAWAHLVRQVEFGPRPAGSEALARTRRHLIEQLEAAGVETREQPFVANTPLGEVPMVNVIGRIPGNRPERIALASHYDTKRFPFRFVGANDGASSTAAVLELARVLTARRNEFTVEILLFDGEEAIREVWDGDDNTYGSRHYVRAAREDGSLAGLRALVLLDMVGGRSPTFRREANSTPWLVDLLWETAGRLGHRRHFSNDLVAIEDDHIPFLRAGVPAADIIQDIADYPAWHTADDDLDQVSADSLQIVGDVVLAAWPEIERHLSSN